MQFPHSGTCVWGEFSSRATVLSSIHPITSKATLDTFEIGRRWRFVTDPRDGRADIGDVDVHRQLTTSHQVCGQCRYLAVG
jgi:hypothetical protein